MYAGRKKCLSALADRHNVFILQGDTGAEIDVPRVLLRLPKDEDNGFDAGVTMGVVPAVGLILVDPAAGRQILRDAAFALDRIAEHLIHFWRTNLGIEQCLMTAGQGRLFMQDALHKQLEIQL